MDKVIEKILDFKEARNWGQFHNFKDLAISLNLEASELLENFQWKTSEGVLRLNKENIKEELADVLIYSILIADQLNVEVEEIIIDKLKKNEVKYPIGKSYGSNKKYSEL